MHESRFSIYSRFLLCHCEKRVEWVSAFRPGNLQLGNRVHMRNCHGFPFRPKCPIAYSSDHVILTSTLRRRDSQIGVCDSVSSRGNLRAPLRSPNSTPPRIFPLFPCLVLSLNFRTVLSLSLIHFPTDLLQEISISRLPQSISQPSWYLSLDSRCLGFIEASSVSCQFS